jgi:polar amino acid transport system substrate-binding protein
MATRCSRRAISASASGERAARHNGAMPVSRLSALLLALMVGPVAAAPAAVPASPPVTVTLHYQERPPYYQTRADGGVQGLVGDSLLRALARGGLAYRLALTPSQRQLRLIEEGQSLDCGIGWFRNPAREAKGQFSTVLYRDQPLGLIARSTLGWSDAVTMREAVQRADARLLVKQGFSYGSAFDAQLAQRPKPPESSSGEVPVLMRMLHADRADWLPVSPEEGQLLLALPSEPLLPPGSFQLLRFADAPPGATRHLYCNKAVPTDWLQRLDEALK